LDMVDDLVLHLRRGSYQRNQGSCQKKNRSPGACSGRTYTKIGRVAYTAKSPRLREGKRKRTRAGEEVREQAKKTAPRKWPFRNTEKKKVSCGHPSVLAQVQGGVRIKGVLGKGNWLQRREKGKSGLRRFQEKKEK